MLSIQSQGLNSAGLLRFIKLQKSSVWYKGYPAGKEAELLRKPLPKSKQLTKSA